MCDGQSRRETVVLRNKKLYICLNKRIRYFAYVLEFSVVIYVQFH